MRLKTLSIALLVSSSLSSCASVKNYDYNPANIATIEKVADFNHQVTGVAVTEDNRKFVNFPRWTEDAPVSVAEVNSDGSISAYPNDQWNLWRNSENVGLSPQNHFICVQSVFADKMGNLWVLDPAAPNLEKIVKDGPKLVKIDLATDSVERVYSFDETIAKQASYLNDVRISPDGNYAYMTDSGLRGAIVVLDLNTGEARRVLDGHFSTQAEKGVVLKVDGKELRRPDGRTMVVASDGIELSLNGDYLYWQALTGRTLYRVPTAILRDESLTTAQVASHVETIGSNGVADGLLINRQGHMFISSVEDDSIKLRTGVENPTLLVKDDRLNWPDSFAEGPDGAVYVTTSHIHHSLWFNIGADKQLKTELWRIEP